jgi:hypothetical protein
MDTSDPRLEALVMQLPPTSRARHDYDLLTSGKPQVMVRLDESQLAEIRELSEQAFRAGFAACQEGTTKYGEYIGLSIEEEFDDWIKSQSTSAP